MFLFLFFSMLLLCSFFRLKELFQVKNGVTTFFFFENAKNLGQSDDGKRREKRGWPWSKLRIQSIIIYLLEIIGTSDTFTWGKSPAGLLMLFITKFVVWMFMSCVLSFCHNYLAFQSLSPLTNLTAGFFGEPGKIQNPIAHVQAYTPSPHSSCQFCRHMLP